MRLCSVDRPMVYRIHRIIVLVYLSRHCPKFFSFPYLLSLTEFSSQNEPMRHPGKTVHADVPNKRPNILRKPYRFRTFPRRVQRPASLRAI